jgi:hypothetical protein
LSAGSLGSSILKSVDLPAGLLTTKLCGRGILVIFAKMSAIKSDYALLISLSDY